VIVGTAGHIDHGKTTLVRALTGVDTDRLPEEKARGISIELGYAYSPLPDGGILGFVDVPGHERFVHTMLSGATGIDFALLVVAADDGPMPQTREHLAILSLLGIEAGAVALTKVDVVDDSRVDESEREIRVLLASTALAEARVFKVSGRTGKGVGELREFLEHKGADRAIRRADGRFRLAVDRSFTLAGIGTVVTGTVHSGEVRPGDVLTIVPTGLEVRVRGLHAQNRAADQGRAGERCALNLAGIARDEVRRGDWIAAPASALSTDRFDARLELLAGEPKALRSGSAVQVHLGAAHVPGRVVVLDAPAAETNGSADVIAPGQSRLVQLTLHEAIGAWHGDRFIVRDAAATRTIGGGRVLDPGAPSRYRRTADRLAVLAALEAPTPEEQLAKLVARAAHGVDLEQFARAHAARDGDAIARSLPARHVAGSDHRFLIDESRWEDLGQRVLEQLDEFHRAHPDELGPDPGRLKRIALPRLDDRLFRALIGDLVAGGQVRQGGPWLHLPGHDNAPSAQERALVEGVRPRLLVSPFDPPWVRDLAKALSQPEALVRTTLIRASKRGEVFQVVHDLFYHPAAVRDLAAIASDLQGVEGEVRAAAFRDRTGLGRKRAIQILEFFDRVGFTRRVRDRHLVRGDSLLALDVATTAPARPRERRAEQHP
jgi:selenocysteine-specific elongation factor